MASLVAQTVTRLPAMQETRVGFLGREDPLEKKEMAIHSSTLAWKIPWTEDTAHGVAKSRTRLSDFTYLSYCILSFKRLVLHLCDLFLLWVSGQNETSQDMI